MRPKKALKNRPLNQTRFLLLPVAKVPVDDASSPMFTWDEDSLAWEEMREAMSEYQCGRAPRVDWSTAESLYSYRDIVAHICGAQTAAVVNDEFFHGELSQVDLQMALLRGCPGHIRLHHEGSVVLKFILSAFSLRNHVLAQHPSYARVPSEKIEGDGTCLFQEAVRKGLPAYILDSVTSFQPKDAFRGPIPHATLDISEQTILNVVLAILGAVYRTTNEPGAVIAVANDFGLQLPSSFKKWTDFALDISNGATPPPTTSGVNFLQEYLDVQVSRPDIVQRAFDGKNTNPDHKALLKAYEVLGVCAIEFFGTFHVFEKHKGADDKAAATGIGMLLKAPTTLAAAAVSGRLDEALHVSNEQMQARVSAYRDSCHRAWQEECYHAARHHRPMGPYWVKILYPPKILAHVTGAAHGTLIVSEGFDLAPARALFSRTMQPLIDEYITAETVFFQPLIQLAEFIQNRGYTASAWDLITTEIATGHPDKRSFQAELTINGAKFGEAARKDTKNKAMVACASTVLLKRGSSMTLVEAAAGPAQASHAANTSLAGTSASGARGNRSQVVMVKSEHFDDGVVVKSERFDDGFGDGTSGPQSEEADDGELPWYAINFHNCIVM
ncbi:hypothetical protein BOTBODRAFT_370913 [Botryobasidium botryosum FD-172 SS1]|uniref:DRBM domain-containing protein n=1 Tax=Botryobasidium botryosum (strain FD-172 SS1) TaxID=930990 RepID=A0A067MFS0_BOTB1|nr:hypothetical protein BOTBODRAFT_370913 [Botryobasidium botryosum FD-172 SS1]